MPNAATGTVFDNNAMPTSDSEPEDRWHYLPEFAMWAALTIDPVASLSAGARGVPEAVEACKQLVSKQYVALVTRHQPLYIPWAPYHTYPIHLLQQGHPPAVPEKFLEPSMSVPVLPTTQETHISGRAPVKSSEMLPWSDCFLAFSGDHAVRSSMIWPSEPPRWTVDQRENIRLDDLMFGDSFVARAKKDLLQTDKEADCDEADSIGRPESSRSVGTGVDVVQGDSEEDQDEDRFWQREYSKAMTTVRITQDLSRVTELNDIADYFKEVQAIERIEKEAASRVKECRALRSQNEMIRAQEIHAAVGERHSSG
ncbi:hypothetical protein R3P38DRAFT_80201 [Favolaschia claudopus]|uniref:Uncharacterized protein n=1 Tax=Favolaschia claudopus TaxID=2862362 RepID=A0AAW0D5Q6_9AGAR